MPPSRRALPRPAGLAFDIPDLVMLQGWAEFHDLVMTLSLDTVIAGADYEEFVVLRDAARPGLSWQMWRSADGIAVQTNAGKPRLFALMTEALELLIPTAD